MVKDIVLTAEHIGDVVVTALSSLDISPKILSEGDIILSVLVDTLSKSVLDSDVVATLSDVLDNVLASSMTTSDFS